MDDTSKICGHCGKKNAQSLWQNVSEHKTCLTQVSAYTHVYIRGRGAATALSRGLPAYYQLCWSLPLRLCVLSLTLIYTYVCMQPLWNGGPFVLRHNQGRRKCTTRPTKAFQPFDVSNAWHPVSALNGFQDGGACLSWNNRHSRNERKWRLRWGGSIAFKNNQRQGSGVMKLGPETHWWT